MSGKVMGAVWELDLPHSKQLVLLALADHADHDGNNVFASVGLIAWKTGYSERQVQRIMHECEADGLLKVTTPATPRKPAVYHIDVSAGNQKQPYKGRQDVTPEKTAKAKPTKANVTPEVTPLRHPRGDTQMSPDPYSQPSSKPLDKKEDPAPPQPTLTALALANTNAGTTNIASVGSSGNGKPQPPGCAVPPIPAPPHYTWLYSSDSLASMHLIADKGNQTNYNQQHALCETPVQHRSKLGYGLECVNRPCPECQRIATETNLLLFALAHVTGADPNLNRDVKDLARDLQKAGYVAEDVATYESMWRKGWQYQKNPGEKPGLEWVRSHIGSVKSDIGQSRYDPAYELTARIRELRRGEPIADRRIRYANEIDDHPSLGVGDAPLIEAVGVDEVSREASA